MPDSAAPFPVQSQTSSVTLPPHSLEAERSLLGGLLLSDRAWEKVADAVIEEDFYRADHRLIFHAIRSLKERNEAADAITVSEWFERNGELDKVAGGAYITELANETASAANIVAYAKIVRERSILRQLIEVGSNITSNAYANDGRDTRELLEAAEKEVFAIADRSQRQRSGIQNIKDVLIEASERLEELSTMEGEISGIPTGFKDLDRMTAGLQRSDLVIVAGRPSMGKTTFAMNLAENAAIRHNIPVAIFSMEMSAVQLVFRMFSSLGQIPQDRLRTGQLQDRDWPNLTSVMNMLNESGIFIDETPSMSPGDLRARARRLKREHDIGMIVVDYLQLMQVPGNSENRATEISEISRSLKAVAKELNVPVVALSQLNRSLEQRPDKRPVMSDLRESGAIEQDADLIMFIYRDEVYNPETNDKGKAEILIRKHRNGETGSVSLAFQGKWLRFSNFIPDQFYDEMAG